jgi:heterodisulfide reductase subunit A
MTLTKVHLVEGEQGNFTVRLRRQPRDVDEDKYIGCSGCPDKCPRGAEGKFSDNFEEEVSVKVGAIILSPGYRPFDPCARARWGYGKYPNVITATELEHYLSVAGPTAGHLLRPSDGRPVTKMAFLQCIGSRDHNQLCRDYCSAVCCTYAIKQAIQAIDHNRPLSVTIFHTDLRTHGKNFERLFNQAKERGISFERCRVHAVQAGESPKSVNLRFVTENGRQMDEDFDLVVLSVGIEPPLEAAALAERTGIELTPEGFAATSCFSPVSTSRSGIFACGRFLGPMDIPLSVIGASAAATGAGILLSDQRYAMSRQVRFTPERDVSGEGSRIGVFVCSCGSNISEVVDLNEVARYAESLPCVVFVEKVLVACSRDSQELIGRRIQDENLNRVVVAACTPRTHEPLFRAVLKASGLNECLFEMANIRNQVAWVHAAQPEQALRKAKDMVRMAVAKAALLKPAPAASVRITPRALVIGGGLAGMTAALALADQGFPVDLVEKAAQLGGIARHLLKTWKGDDVLSYMEMLIARVREHNLINLHLKSTVTDAQGYVGSFRSTIQRPTGTVAVDHGVTILATGAQPYRPAEYGYGHSQNIVTSLEFDRLRATGDERIRKGRNFVFIQCVGSREPDHNYCSRVCCTHSIQSAVSLMEDEPERRIFILHKDIRAYGLRENLYRRARELGVVFINYDEHRKPNVVVNQDRIVVIAWDHVLSEPFGISADVVRLATAIVPYPGTGEIAGMYKLSVDMDGFLQDAYRKFQPVDFSDDGIFFAGLAHYPKPIEESIAQALAAVSRAVTVLSNRWLDLDRVKARVDESRCDCCALCVDVCPYGALAVKPEDSVGEVQTGKPKLFVQPAKCKGCGACQAACPREGIGVTGFSTSQLAVQVRAALQ